MPNHASASVCPATSPALQDDQLEQFDFEFANDQMREDFFALVSANFGDRAFTHLDVGGGNGRFTDRLLERFPRCRSTVVDVAEILLRRNRPHPRKEVLLAAAEQMHRHLGGRRFGLITLNWMLHHLSAGSYHRTRGHQLAVLREVERFLAPGGRVSVFEDLIEGLLVRDLPSWLVYQVTSSTLLAPLVRRLGANTAGTGVCFLTERQWRGVFGRAGYDVAQYIPYWAWQLSRVKCLVLHIKTMRNGLFWLAPRRAT